MKQIVCFGASNTYGLIPATHNRYDHDERWTGILASKVSQMGYQVSEEGLCGRTTVFDDPLRYGRRGTELLPVIMETHAPIHTVIVMLGTNDCKTIYNASDGDREHLDKEGHSKLADGIFEKLAMLL